MHRIGSQATRPALITIRVSGPALAWTVATLAVMVVVGRYQVRDRGPLVWDEVARLSEAFEFSYAIERFDLRGAWAWIHEQIFWPFLPPLLSGLVMLVADQNVAAWFPSLVAFSLSGVLAGRLAATLGAGETGAWMAAMLCWSTPLGARLAAGAFTEPLGACQVLLVLWMLARLERERSVQPAILLGLTLGLGWFIKFDYGVLTAATAGAAGILAWARSRSIATLRPYALAAAAFLVVFGAWISFNFDRKRAGIWGFANESGPGASDGADWAYYPHALLRDVEVGLSRWIAALFLASVIWAIVCVRRRPTLSGGLLCLGLGYVMYSLAADARPPYARYLGPVLPVLAVLSAAAVADALHGLRSWVERESIAADAPPRDAGHGHGGAIRNRAPARVWTRAAIAAAIAAPLLAGLAWQLQDQALDERTGLKARFWFLGPNHSVEQAMAFAAEQLGPGDRPVIMIGQTNELNVYALRLAWGQDIGQPAPEVLPVPESSPEDRQSTLRQHIDQVNPGRIVAFDIRPGSVLDIPSVQAQFGSQADYVVIATLLEGEGRLVRVSELAAEGGLLNVIIWEVTPTSSAGAPQPFAAR